MRGEIKPESSEIGIWRPVTEVLHIIPRLYSAQKISPPLPSTEFILSEALEGRGEKPTEKIPSFEKGGTKALLSKIIRIPASPFCKIMGLGRA
jgi:hypothetical protein